MKIEYKEKDKAKQGDIIKFEDEVIGLVVYKGEWENKTCKGELAVVLLKDEDIDEDWIGLSSVYQEDFEQGDYEIIGNIENAKLILGGEKEK